jgi:hypothetical protein
LQFKTLKAKTLKANESSDAAGQQLSFDWLEKVISV